MDLILFCRYKKICSYVFKFSFALWDNDHKLFNTYLLAPQENPQDLFAQTHGLKNKMGSGFWELSLEFH